MSPQFFGYLIIYRLREFFQLLRAQVTMTMFSDRNGSFMFFPLPYHQHERDLCQFGIPYLLAGFFIPVVNLGANIGIIQEL